MLERFEYEKKTSSKTNVSDIIVFIKYNKNLTLYTKLFFVAASLFALSSPIIRLNIYVLYINEYILYAHFMIDINNKSQLFDNKENSNSAKVNKNS